VADHVDQQLLDAVATLVGNLTTTQSRVYVMHPEDRALQADEIPALLLYLGSETVESATLDGDMVQRTVAINIGVRIKGVGAIDETLTLIRAEVETALGPSITIGSKHVLLDYKGMSEPELNAENDQPMISARLDFQAILFNATSAPTALL
jgi:hypothetical protein